MDDLQAQDIHVTSPVSSQGMTSRILDEEASGPRDAFTSTQRCEARGTNREAQICDSPPTSVPGMPPGASILERGHDVSPSTTQRGDRDANAQNPEMFCDVFSSVRHYDGPK